MRIPSKLTILSFAIFISISLLNAQSNEEDKWNVPSCAWSRPIGNHPEGATGRTKRGVPLGGIGAGNFMFNLCGTFGPWELKTGFHEEKFLSQAAFHVFEKLPGQPPKITTLATEDVLSSWNKIEKNSGTYYALYPKAWFKYQSTIADVTLKQFTPIFPHNYEEVSYPVGIFQFRVSNPSTDTLIEAIMFTFPNAAYGNDKRSGFMNYLINEDGISGIVLKASNEQNVSTTQNTEWCIAVKEEPGCLVSFCTSWYGGGSGEDIYNEFKDDGTLPDKSLDSSFSASAIAVKISLAPGASAVIPFVLSWDFPIVKFGGGTEWYRRYTEYFGLTAGHSAQISREALLNLNEWENKVDQWQSLIINEPEYPDWLKQGALNELYYDTFGGVFWENGCKTKPEESSYGTLPPEDHKYFNMECIDYAMCETFDVRHYEARHYLEFWPEIEKDVLKWFADYIYNDPAGSAPHDEGAPARDPFFSFSGYGSNWQDMPSKFIQQVYAYYHKTQDSSFLDFVWPACVKTYDYMKTHDTNGNGLPDAGNTTYDTWGLYGDNLLCGGLWIGALEAMEKMAAAKNDISFADKLKAEYSAANRTLDSLLWKDELQYYKIYPSSDAIMADGLNGERYCETSGLASILPEERMISHLKKVFDMCVKPLKDFTGDGIGDMGAINGRNSNGTSIGNGQPREVWTGSSYFIAAMMYHMGKKFNDEDLKLKALETAYGVYYQTWINEQSAYFFNTPEAWDGGNPAQFRAQQYQRPRAIWELLLEIKNPFDDLSSVDTEEPDQIPEKTMLFQNYPNPFNPETNFEFQIAKSGFVSLKIYDITGKRVATLLEKELTPGNYHIPFSISNFPLSSGVYFYQLKSDNFLKTKKFLLLK